MRRFLFWSLCFCLLFPVGLSSCDGSDSAAVIFGGTTGELTWTLTEDGVLTITGEGPMPDYRDGGTSETPPWYPHVNRISSLTIGEGVTRIGDYAFMLCSFVTEVVIPESVTSMGDWAFEGYLDMAVVTCLAVIPPELGKDNFGFPAKILYVPAGSVEVYRKNAVWREAFETIAALPCYSCLWAGGAENEISPYPAKGYGDISFSESAVSRRIIFPVGLALFLWPVGAPH